MFVVGTWWRCWEWLGQISVVEGGCGTEREAAAGSPGQETSGAPRGEAGREGEADPAGSPGSSGTGGTT